MMATLVRLRMQPFCLFLDLKRNSHPDFFHQSDRHNPAEHHHRCRAGAERDGLLQCDLWRCAHLQPSCRRRAGHCPVLVWGKLIMMLGARFIPFWENLYPNLHSSLVQFIECLCLLIRRHPPLGWSDTYFSFVLFFNRVDAINKQIERQNQMSSVSSSGDKFWKVCIF